MLGGRTARWGIAAGLLIASVAAGAQPAHAPTLRAMQGVAPGRWLFRMVGDVRPPRENCVVDPAVFLRMRLRAAECSRFVIDDSVDSLTVHYTCPGTGHVRTVLRADTPRSLRIDSEGMVNGMPFSDAMTVRRVGECRTPAR